MSTWKITYQLRHHDVLEGLTATVEGQAELGGHFPPKPVVVYAVEQALVQAKVTPGDVTGLVITIEKTEPTPP